MGVPKFYGAWLSKKPFNNVVAQPRLPSDVSSISIDMNSYIYKTANKVYALTDDETFKKLSPFKQDQILRRREYIRQNSNNPDQLENEHLYSIGNELDNMLAAVSVSMEDDEGCFTDKRSTPNLKGRPLKNFVLAIDGVAPQAKIAQQRTRRFRGAKENPQDGPFSTISISPGTDFMRKLDNYLKTWISTNRRTLGQRVIYSSHLSPGEAEHKIMDYFRDGHIIGAINDPNHTLKGEGSHVIHGMDTDLIMLTILSDTRRIYLWREDINIVLNIDNLREEITKMLGVHSKSYRDFVVMMFLLGNDFLPYQPSLDDYENSIDKLIDAYKTIGKPITDDDGLIWSNYLEVLEQISKIEPILLHHESGRRFKFKSKVFEKSYQIIQSTGGVSSGQLAMQQTVTRRFNYNNFRNAWYSYALGPRNSDDSEDLIEKMLGYSNPFKIDSNDITKMASHYLTGIAWIYSYYTKGPRSISQRWYYPYFYSPTISDIHHVLKLLLNENLKIVGWEYNNEGPLSSIHQLLSIIPPQLNYLVPEEVRYLTLPDSPIADYYPTDFIIDRSGFNEDYRGVTLIPFVDPYRIINAVNKYSTFTAERAQLYTPQNDIVSDLEENEIMSVCYNANVQSFIDNARKNLERAEKYNKHYQEMRGRGRGSEGGRGRGGRGRGRSRGGRGRGRGRKRAYGNVESSRQIGQFKSREIKEGSTKLQIKMPGR